MAKNSDNASPSDAGNEHEGWSTKTRVILGLIGIAIFIVAYLIAWRLLPTQWTNFITGMTDNSVTTSWLLGLVIGFVFSLVPILIYLMGLRLRKSWKGIIGWFIVAVAIALPNIITIGVSTGDSKAEQSAAAIMTTNAPGFITASYVGIALGVAVGLWVAWVTYSRRSAKRKAEEMKDQREQKAMETAQAQQSAASASDATSDTSDTSGMSDTSDMSGAADGAGHAAGDAAGGGEIDSVDDSASNARSDVSDLADHGSDRLPDDDRGI